MKTKYLFLAALGAITFASCTSDEFVGITSDNSPTEVTEGAIEFGLKMPNATRANIAGGEAAKLLGYNFYVTGTKGTEPANSPTTSLVFDNYLVHYDVNTAGTTESNTANWEYVGIEQAPASGLPTVADRVKLSSITGPQTIKYWDYSVDQYDFLAFSTGIYKALKAPVSYVAPSDVNKEIYVEAMKYGAGLASEATAYSFDLPSLEALENAFISDITEVTKASGSYGKDVTLKFKNLGSKVRIAIYETVPGYSVKDVEFYQVDGTTDISATTYPASYLIGANNYSFPTKAKINVYFPHVGTTYQSGGTSPKQDYDIAAAKVDPVSDTYATFKTFGALTNQLVTSELAEKKETSTPGTFVAEDGKVFLGRSLPGATFAGNADEAFYQTVFPNTSGYPVTLRVNYTLVPIDGATETIKVYGARAVVPSTYTTWLPNYAYTYIFKISDNTNGWTSTATTTDPAGLFPITFDAVVAEPTDVTGEQTTITTVATPTITTYQQNHNTNKDGKWLSTDEYAIATGKNIYVQVMDNNLSPAVLVGTGTSELPLLNAAQESASPKYHASVLYKVDDGATEAMVMDALQNRTTEVGNYNTDVIGRNDITLTYDDNINNAVTSIENGVDNNAITPVTEGTAAEINIANLVAGTYAYVYDYSWKSESAAWTTSTTYNNKENTKVYQPISVTKDVAVGSKITGTTKNCISTTTLATKTAASYFTADEGGVPGAGEAVNSNSYVYFSKTNKTTVAPVPPATEPTYSYTYSYVSVDGKARVPAGLLKVPVTELEDASSSTTAVEGTFYFEIYYRNNGKYAVKVIKVQ